MRDAVQVLANFLKIYHTGGGKEKINRALGRDYLKNTKLSYQNCGVFNTPSYPDQLREMGSLFSLCRAEGLDLLSVDDFIGSRSWRCCCGTDGLRGFEGIAKWAYHVNGYRIQDYCSFDEYMAGLDCPWHEEFQHEWDSGKLARAVPGLIFHPEDKTYSRVMSSKSLEMAGKIC